MMMTKMKKDLTMTDRAVREIAEDLHVGDDQTRRSDAWVRFLAKNEFDFGGSFHGSLTNKPTMSRDAAGAVNAFARELFGELYDGNIEKLDADACGEHAGKVNAWWPSNDSDGDGGERALFEEWLAHREKCEGDSLRSGLVAAHFVEAAARAISKAEEEERESGNPVIDPDTKKMTQAVVDRAAQKMAQTASAVYRLAKKDGDKLDRDRNAIGSMAGDKPGTPITKAPSREVLKHMRLNKTFGKVMRLVGRMRPIVRSMRSKTKVSWMRDEVVGVEIGGDISRMLSSEAAMMMDETAELDLMRRIAERQIFQRSMVGFDDAGRGPVVFCLDESGSMDGDRDEWSKAVAVSMAEVAMKEGRVFALVHFSNDVDRVDIVKKKIGIDKLVEMVGFFSNGGTSFGPPISKSLDIIEAERKFRRADIVFLTDGEGRVQESTISRIRRAEARLHVILIGATKLGATMSKAADSVSSIPDLSAESIKDMSLVFGAI